RIVQYKDGKGNIVPVYRNLKDLYDWDKNFLSKVINGDNSFAKPLVDSIIKKCHSKKEIVSGIYKWVQKNISYIAIENGLGGFIPRSPDTVFRRRYGDCKDMTCLLVSMLKAANIDAHYVWIGTRDIPYDYNKVPTSYSANHMVVAWKDKGKYHFLDATSDYLPFGYPSTFIQDKIALIYVNDNKYDTVRVPITPATANKQIHRIHFTLNDDKLEGSDSAYVIGYLAGNIKRTYATLSSNDKHDHWQNWFQVGNNTYTLEENSLTINPSDTATLSCKFHISNYAVKVGDEIYINPILDRKWNGSIIPANRKAPYISDEKYAIFNQYIFTIPEGYTLKFLPKGGEDNQANFSFKITYKKIGQNKVIATYKLIINELNTEPENFDSWNTFAKKLKKITNQNIILKKN
ncbi:MAG TPA: transglutaminase family protein, partial [Arachidicoccus soli]|nr:transglutaminase family protein [Arachidicoccus soli]